MKLTKSVTKFLKAFEKHLKGNEKAFVTTNEDAVSIRSFVYVVEDKFDLEWLADIQKGIDSAPNGNAREALIDTWLGYFASMEPRATITEKKGE